MIARQSTLALTAAGPLLALEPDEVRSETNGSRTVSGVIKPSSEPASGKVRTSQSYKYSDIIASLLKMWLICEKQNSFRN